MRFDQKLATHRILAPERDYWCEGEVTELDKQGRDYFIYKDHGSNILAVAHLDTVADRRIEKAKFDVIRNKGGGTTIRSINLDDRLGAHILLDVLPTYGIKCDILLTTGEESGQSTARDFQPPEGKEYNWIFSFDRRGRDVVMYQYHTSKLTRLLEKVGFKVGQGSFSDIASLNHLGVSGFNFGVGYNHEHSSDCYAVWEIAMKQVRRFSTFYETYKDRQFKYQGWSNRSAKLDWRTNNYAGGYYSGDIYDDDPAYWKGYRYNQDKLVNENNRKQDSVYAPKGSTGVGSTIDDFPADPIMGKISAYLYLINLQNGWHRTFNPVFMRWMWVLGDRTMTERELLAGGWHMDYDKYLWAWVYKRRGEIRPIPNKQYALDNGMNPDGNLLETLEDEETIRYDEYWKKKGSSGRRETRILDNDTRHGISQEVARDKAVRMHYPISGSAVVSQHVAIHPKEPKTGTKLLAPPTTAANKVPIVQSKGVSPMYLDPSYIGAFSDQMVVCAGCGFLVLPEDYYNSLGICSACREKQLLENKADSWSEIL